MGFEVIFSYHERLEGGYDKENTKTMKKKVGKADDEVATEKLAGTIMAQLARRDIWVVDVEVFEFTKKKLSFKESKDGLVIGNKKYLFLECGGLGVQEIVEQPPEQFKPQFGHSNLPATIPSEAMRGEKNANFADFQLLKKRPLRYEIFQPDLAFGLPMRGLAFTVGDKYAIYQEKAAGNDNRMGMNYTTIDNNGHKQVLNDKYFVLPTNLIGGEQFNERKDINLQYGELNGEFPMPKLR